MDVDKFNIRSCWECPFCNNDSEYGKDSCNLDKNIVMKAFDEMPRYDVHEKCPLKKTTVMAYLYDNMHLNKWELNS